MVLMGRQAARLAMRIAPAKVSVKVKKSKEEKGRKETKRGKSEEERTRDDCHLAYDALK